MAPKFWEVLFDEFGIDAYLAPKFWKVLSDDFGIDP
jgi:hypothetical protein